MIERAESHTVAPQVLEDFRAAQEYCRRTGYRGRLTVRRDAAGRRTVVNLSPADRLIQIDRELGTYRRPTCASNVVSLDERPLKPGVVRDQKSTPVCPRPLAMRDERMSYKDMCAAVEH